MNYLEERPIPRKPKFDWRYWVLVAVVVALLEIAISCAAASVKAGPDVLGDGPVIAPTPTLPYIVITEDPMPRLYVPDTYLPYVGKGE